MENASFIFPGEVIVDNEDSTLQLIGTEWWGCCHNGSTGWKMTRSLFVVSNWRPPLRWTLTTNDKYWYPYPFSLCGEERKRNPDCHLRIPYPSRGQYDLYYWVYKPDELRRGREGGRRAARKDAEYHFKIRYDGSEEDGYINLQRSEEGGACWGAISSARIR